MGKRLHLIVDFFLQHFGMGGGEGSEHTVGGRKFVGEVKMNIFIAGLGRSHSMHFP